MRKEVITDKEAICLYVAFSIGSSLIMGCGSEAKNDAWIAVLAGAVMAVPTLLVYCRLLAIYHGKDLFEILELTLGKWLGAIVTVIYILYAFHLGALVFRNFGEFINIIAMPETPMLFSLFCIGIVCIIAARLGIEVMGRTTTYFLPIVMFIIVAVQLIGIPILRVEYLKPVLGNGLAPVLEGGFSTFSFPLAETVLFAGLFSSLKTKKSPYRVYFWGLLIALSLILLATIRNICILGNTVGSFYFPSYAAVSKINIGDFIQRIEVTVSFVYIFGILMKGSVCLLVASKGLAKLLRLNNYSSVVIQIGLLMILFSYTVYDNSMEMKYWAFRVYPYYAFPMQVIIPVILWIVAETKSRKGQLKIHK